ncbi:hypothetical protein [Levilinea saccharolytica]|uniref:Uncharacterized protein n=1 Tax=Levilinea saccharolytica TaxID=229921 RepID=A0A0P6XRA3_9CHLR|nr:hypothetical protein [Levilinea saccharolytica]KPL85024.1 hypothetical protein ADN01_06520 [Levilinea saccharolytica]GAP18127.1 hypothetical protein LSAC_02012 [Levilinea saccharolytica]
MRDLRKYARQTNTRLIVGGILLLFIVGIGLIYLLYGPAAASMGFLCMGVGLIPLLMIFLFLWVIEWVTKKANDN